MNSYSAKNIRNICFLGHSGNGKTSLAESMLYLTGGTDRLGRIADGNTVCDSDAEEVKRQISISLALAPVEYKGNKINVLDAPGAFDFAGETLEALAAADCAVLVCSAKDGLSVGAERAWKVAKQAAKPRFIHISRIDEENADFQGTVDALKGKFGSAVIPVMLPIPGGWVDVLAGKAYEWKGNKAAETAVPASVADELESLRAELTEAAAGADEELMEKYFDAGELTAEEMARGLKLAVIEGSLCPVTCASAVSGEGVTGFMDALLAMAPDPTHMTVAAAEDSENEIKADPAAPTCAQVFKTISDQYGKYSLIKVVSGRVSSDMTLVDSTTGSNEKLGRLYILKGKKTEEVKEIPFGDIGAIGKMDRVKTNDTLSDPANPAKVAPIPFAVPCYSRAIVPNTRGQEDKVASGLIRLNEEDPSFSLENNAETRQVVLSGAGDIQLDVLVSKLKSRFNVEATLDTPRVAYREKIRKTVDQHARHKKQTGGSGQFADVVIRFEPNPEQEEMVFAEEVFGGSVPKNFFPAVEKGLRDAVNHGVLAGYPVVYLKAVLHDGSYHPVDSSEIAFKTAAQLAYKEALPQANPVLLEPIGELKVTVPDSYMGDVIGDLNKRRGRVMGMDPTGDGDQVITAEVPMGEMLSYAIDLRSITQSRGSFTFNFVRYEDCPPAAQEKAIADAKAMQDEE